jgi:curved DNA-binding protein CbpA
MITNGPNDRYYRSLELRPDASQAEIVAAYRRLAHGAHPDTHPEDPEAPARFREITEAYEVLTDPAQRHRRANSRGDGAGTPITVVVRTTPARSGPHRANPTDPPVVLGGPSLAVDTPLRAGPVHVERNQTAPAPLRDDVEAGDERNGPFRLFSDLFGSFWRY